MNQFSSIVTKTINKYHQFFKPVDIAIDFGTSTTRIGIDGKGMVLSEPSYIGLNTKTHEYIFFGTEAKQIYGKTPQFISIIKPVENSILSDFDASIALIDHFTRLSVFPYYTKNRFIRTGLSAYISTSQSSTEVQQKALIEAVKRVGYVNAYLIERPFLAASGAGYQIFGNKPICIIDMGAGSVEIAVIIMGGVVGSKTIPVGGDYLDAQITSYIHLKYGILTGDLTIQNVKESLLHFGGENNTMSIRGKSLENGLPKSIRVSTNDIREAVSTSINQIIDGIKEIIETIPPEIVDGIFKSGIILTGGGALSQGIDHFIGSEVKIPVISATKPENATIQGLLQLMTQKNLLPRIIV